VTDHDALELRADALALAHLQRNGLRPRDVACVPAAAGGPKGLGLIPLDHRLFDREHGWLSDVQHLELVGASIGAWRMAAAASADPGAALQRLADGYIAQRYSRRPSAREVSEQCRRLARGARSANANALPMPRLPGSQRPTRGACDRCSSAHPVEASYGTAARYASIVLPASGFTIVNCTCNMSPSGTPSVRLTST